MQAGIDVAAVGNTAGVRAGEAGHVRGRPGEVREAIELAYRVGVTLHAQRQRELQVRRYRPLILRVNAQSPHSDWNVARRVERLAILVGDAVHEVLHASRIVAEVNPWIAPEEVVVAHVVPAEIEAELEVMSPARQRHIVEELVLRDVPALREGALRVEPAEGHRSRVHNL